MAGTHTLRLRRLSRPVAARKSLAGLGRRGRAALLALLLALTAGCGQQGNGALRDYLGRVARPLGTSAGAVNIAPLPELPRWESLQIPLESGSLNGLDFLRLRGCALQQAVARRNSSLGRLAPPSQRLLLDLEFLRLAPECIRKLQGDGRNSLAQVLRDNLILKKQQLPAAIFNATLGNAEYRNLWRANGVTDDYPDNTSSLVIEDLRAVRHAAQRWLAGDYNSPERNLKGISAV